MTVPKLTSDDSDGFYLAFQGSDRRKVLLSGIPGDYLLIPNDTGNYDLVWKSREDKLKNFMIFVGKS